MVSTSQVSLKALPEPSGLHVEVVRNQHVTTVFVTGDVERERAGRAAIDLMLRAPSLSVRTVLGLTGAALTSESPAPVSAAPIAGNRWRPPLRSHRRRAHRAPTDRARPQPSALPRTGNEAHG